MQDFSTIKRLKKPGNGPLAHAVGVAYHHDVYEVGQLNQQITALVKQIQSAAATGRANELAAARAQLPSAAMLKSDQEQQTLLLDSFQNRNLRAVQLRHT